MVRCESRSTISHITLGTKQTSALSTEIPHAGCDVPGTGNGLAVWLLRLSERKRGAMARPDPLNAMPALDPTSLIRSHVDLRPEQKDTDPAAINVVFIDFGI